MTFGEKLQQLRKDRGWSQERLAEEIPISRQAVSKWESGGAAPDTENVVRLSDIFGVSTDYLLHDDFTGDEDIPAVKRREEELQKARNRETGMMVLVEGMGEAGFFDWVSLRLARALGFRPMAILLSFMILAALLAMFVDSVTVILFLVAATVRLAQYLRFDPVPLIIGEIFAANLGGAATMTGDPPNIILGTSLGLSFWDFLQNNGIICLAGLGLALVYFYVCFHNKLKRREKGVAPELWEIDPGDAIPNHRIFRVRVGLFAAVVLLIATHTLTGLTMPSIGILAAGATLCTTKYPWGLLKQVEWKTLGFLVGLFLTVSGLEQTGLLNGLAQVLAKLAGGSSLAGAFPGDLQQSPVREKHLVVR